MHPDVPRCYQPLVDKCSQLEEFSWPPGDTRGNALYFAPLSCQRHFLRKLTLSVRSSGAVVRVSERPGGTETYFLRSKVLVPCQAGSEGLPFPPMTADRYDAEM